MRLLQGSREREWGRAQRHPHVSLVIRFVWAPREPLTLQPAARTSLSGTCTPSRTHTGEGLSGRGGGVCSPQGLQPHLTWGPTWSTLDSTPAPHKGCKLATGSPVTSLSSKVMGAAQPGGVLGKGLPIHGSPGSNTGWRGKCEPEPLASQLPPFPSSPGPSQLCPQPGIQNLVPEPANLSTGSTVPGVCPRCGEGCPSGS